MSLCHIKCGPFYCPLVSCTVGKEVSIFRVIFFTDVFLILSLFVRQNKAFNKPKPCKATFISVVRPCQQVCPITQPLLAHIFMFSVFSAGQQSIHSKKGLGLTHQPTGAFLCCVCMFSSSPVWVSFKSSDFLPQSKDTG